MNLDRDRITIPLGTLTPLSRKTFRLDILVYHLRSFFMKGESSYIPLTRSIRVKLINNVISIQGPALSDNDEIPAMFEEEWKYLFDKYLLKPSFLDALVQLRFVSVNPITIYYQLISNESKNQLYASYELKGLKMKRAVVRPIPTLVPRKDKVKEVPKKKTMLENLDITSIVDGHYQIERFTGDIAGRGSLTSFAEGPVDDNIPDDVEIDQYRDHPNGVLMNNIPGMPFYAFNYRNIYPKIQDINRMIESGMCVVFVEKVENKSIMELKVIYEKFFRDWGIPIIDYVTMDRLYNSGIETISYKTGYTQDVNTNVNDFFVIQRPIEKFHSQAWTGINTERRRGLTGLPWAMDKISGMDLSSTQADDGFLSYFIANGIQRRIQGKQDIQMFFPLLAIHTKGEILRLLNKFEKVVNRKLNQEYYVKQNLMGVYLRSMGEWILLRAMLRKYL